MSSSSSASAVAVAGCGSSSTLSFDHLHPPPPSPPSDHEQLCYVHCHLCDTVLAVSVPSSSLLKTVTVRCGHCSNLLPVNMRGLLLPPPPVAPSFTNSFFCPPNPNNHFQPGTPNPAPNFLLAPPNGANNYLTMSSSSSSSSTRGSSNNHRHPRSSNTSRPPEKRQRVPSAYNRFIKEEIQRIKAGNPDISHREAFSAAAKNWAHLPHIQFGLMSDQTVRRTANIRAHNPHSQDAGEDVRMKDGFFAPSPNVGVFPY